MSSTAFFVTELPVDIVIEGMGSTDDVGIYLSDFWIAQVDGSEVISCGLVRRFDSEVDAIQAALAKLR